MNRNLVFMIFGLVLSIGLAGVILIALFRPDATAVVINAVITMLGLLSGFAVLAHGLTTLTKKVEQVEKQTNGTLSKRDETVDHLTKTIIDYLKDTQK